MQTLQTIDSLNDSHFQTDSPILVTTPAVLHRPYIIKLYILPLNQASKINGNENSIGDISMTFQYKHHGDLSITQIINQWSCSLEITPLVLHTIDL